MDASLHGGSNDTIHCRGRTWQPEILLSSQGSVLVLAMLLAALQKDQTSCVTIAVKLPHKDRINFLELGICREKMTCWFMLCLYYYSLDSNQQV
jgi:hypothetical protein